MENIKAFLEADARWQESECSEIVYAVAASKAAPEIRQLLAAFEQVCELVERGRHMIMCSKSAYERYQTDADDALTAAAPYRKGVV